MTADLVIFDCDGVLIDSEVIAARVFGNCLAAAEFPVSLDEAMELGVGKNRVTLAAAVEARFGRALPEGFFETMRAEVAVAFAAELRPMPGVLELLAEGPGRRCVASNSHLDRVRHALDVTRLLPLFEPHVFSASQVAHGKPAPDLFLFAAERLGAVPGHCLVVEDSPTGIAAAHAAGMLVVGFCGGSHCRAGHAARLREAGCVEVFPDMAALARFLRRS